MVNRAKIRKAAMFLMIAFLFVLLPAGIAQAESRRADYIDSASGSAGTIVGQESENLNPGSGTVLPMAAPTEPTWVTTTTVSTQATLQSAINGASGATRIMLSSNITLVSTINIPAGKTIKIMSNLSGTKRVLSGNEAVRVLINSGTLWSEDIVIANGSSDDGGGGIYNMNAVKMINSTVRDCTVFSTGYDSVRGGGIYNTGDFYMANSTVSNCQIWADYYDNQKGGGIYSCGTLTMVGSTVTGCQIAGDGWDYKGGGIYHENGTLILENCTISDCRLRGNGGGLYICSGEVEINDCVIRDCQVEDGGGGGIYSEYSGLFTMNNSSISNCRAGNGGGGGIQNWYGSLILDNCSIDDCQVVANPYSYGGGSYVAGGGIANYGDLTMTGCIINNNRITYNNSAYWYNFEFRGGGISNQGYGSLSLTYCTISGNSVDDGGNDSIFVAGGGLSSDGYRCWVYLYGCTISDNHVSSVGNPSCIGGGIHSNSYTTMADCVISGNSVDGGYGQGGGVYVDYDLYMNNCTVSDNTASSNYDYRYCDNQGSGGGLFVNYGYTEISDSRFIRNRSYGDGYASGGGAIASMDSWALDSMWLHNVTFSGNTAIRGYVINSYDISKHDARIINCTYSTPFNVPGTPHNYAYNNYDIIYTYGTEFIPTSSIGGTVSITGTATVGSTLTANISGVTPSGATLSYQWKRGGTNITGATNSTYVLTAADHGQSITMTVTGTGAYTGSLTSAGVTAGAQSIGGTVSITGTATVGQTLTANISGVTPSGAALSYQWKRGGTNITGATGSTYVLTAADHGQSITVTVTGTGAYTGTLTSAGVTAGAQSIGGTVSITGTANVGSTLTANTGGVTPSGATLSYQWKRGGTNITGATGSTYTLTAADHGQSITVTVTGTGAYTGSLTSAGVTAGAQSIGGTVSITGTATVGSTLTANTGGVTPSGATLSYQWKRGGTNITGATGSTYVLTAADHGQSITVTVTGTGAYTGSLTSVGVMAGLPQVTSSIFKIDQSGNIINKIPEMLTAGDFLNFINANGNTIVLQKNGVTLSSTNYVGTGTQLIIMSGSTVVRTYTLVITGDLDGDGEITINDLVLMRLHLLGEKLLDNVYAQAALVDDDNDITINDLVQIRLHLLGQKQIEAR